jgi:uncharacterized protein YjbI with pentapeptide repeats
MMKRKPDIGAGRESDFLRLTKIAELDNWEGLRFSSISLQKHILKDMLFDGLRLSSSLLDNCDLSDSSFDLCVFENVVFQDCDLSNSTFLKTKFIRCSFINCTLVETNFDQASISDSTFYRCFGFKTSFDGSDWESVIVSKSTLWDTTFVTMLAKSVTFLVSDLEGASFSAAGLIDCTMHRCDLTDAYSLSSKTTPKVTKCIHKPYVNPHLQAWRKPKQLQNAQRLFHGNQNQSYVRQPEPDLSAHLTWAKPILLAEG